MKIQIGQIVCSLAGHDKGNFQTVISFDDVYLTLCDGKRRKIEKPKRKKIKHVAFTETVLEKNCLITNKQIRNALAKYRQHM